MVPSFHTVKIKSKDSNIVVGMSATHVPLGTMTMHPERTPGTNSREYVKCIRRKELILTNRWHENSPLRVGKPGITSL